MTTNGRRIVDRTIECTYRHSSAPSYRDRARIDLVYDTTEPLSVMMLVSGDHAAPHDGGHAEPWLVSRDVLRDITSGAQSAGMDCLTVRLLDTATVALTLWEPRANPFTGFRGHMTIFVPHGELQAFVADTLTLVPADREIELLDIDKALQTLFA